MEIDTKSQSSVEEMRSIAESLKLPISSVQESGETSYLLKLKPISQDDNTKLLDEVKKKHPQSSELKFETIGPTIGGELTQKAILAVLVSSLFIVIYIAWAFRKIPKPYSPVKFGISAVVALLHDVLVLLGAFSIFGHRFGVEVDSLFVTAVLTVIGFSVHDTIVVFDRVRENLPKLKGWNFSSVVDFSLTETIVRSLNTSVSVLLTLSALLLFGGESIRWFVAALLIGITSGTFSSIFNASPLLVIWESRQSKS